MIPKPDEVKNQIAKNHGYDNWPYMIGALINSRWDDTIQQRIEEFAKEYGRRLLDHVAEVAEVKSTGSGFLHEYVVDKQSILKIKDEL